MRRCPFAQAACSRVREQRWRREEEERKRRAVDEAAKRKEEEAMLVAARTILTARAGTTEKLLGCEDDKYFRKIAFGFVRGGMKDWLLRHDT